jgi:hypothetical protein
MCVCMHRYECLYEDANLLGSVGTSMCVCLHVYERWNVLKCKVCMHTLDDFKAFGGVFMCLCARAHAFAFDQ